MDDTRIFSFIDYIGSGHSDNWVHAFDTIDDLKRILTTQLAHYLALFSQKLRKKEPKIAGKTRELVEFPNSLSSVDTFFPDQDEATSMRNGLKGLHDVMQAIISDGTKVSAKFEKLKQLWLLARYGEYEDSKRLSLPMERFKQHAWSYGRGRRVNEQFAEYNVSCYWTEDPEGDEIIVKFDDADDETPIAWALQQYVRLLIEKYGERNAYELFCRADMRLFAA
ncbi:hypothetical protein ACXR0O_14065 [Verrucomicrobiota bacterium sgz303538]